MKNLQPFTPNGKAENISCKIRNKTEVPTLKILFNIVLEDLAKAIKEEKQIKSI